MSKLPQKHVENSGLNHGICLKQKIQSFKYQCGNSVRRIPGGSLFKTAKMYKTLIIKLIRAFFLLYQTCILPQTGAPNTGEIGGLKFLQILVLRIGVLFADCLHFT